jgi:hypothetical protein
VEASAENNLQTSIVRLDTRDPSKSVRLVEYQGEDVRFSIAEAEGFMASSLGGSGGAIYAPWGMIDMARGPGLPERVADGDLYFIVLDAEGCISWHDPRTGDLLALFRLYDNEWILSAAWTRSRWGTVVDSR